MKKLHLTQLLTIILIQICISVSCSGGEKFNRSGEIIFFKSIYRYHLFNTCNTWVAKALQSSGLDVYPFFIITAGQLYKEIKDQGVILKNLK